VGCETGGSARVGAMWCVGCVDGRVEALRVYPETGISALNEGYGFGHYRLARREVSDLIGVSG